MENTVSVKFDDAAFSAGLLKIKSAVQALSNIKAPSCVDAGDEVQVALQNNYDKLKDAYVDKVIERLNSDVTSLENAAANYKSALSAITSGLNSGDSAQ